LGYRSLGKLARPLVLAGQAERPELALRPFAVSWGQSSPFSGKMQPRPIVIFGIAKASPWPLKIIEIFALCETNQKFV